MVTINLNDPVSIIGSFGVAFFAASLIGAGVTYAVARRVYLVIAIGIALGALASSLLNQHNSDQVLSSAVHR